MKSSLVVVAVVLILGSIFVFSGGAELLQTERSAEVPVGASPDVVDAFKFALEEAQNEIGTPIEGYEPSMFLQLFPGLLESDFEGAAASIGNYTIENGRLTHKFDDTQFIHSAAAALTPVGMGAVLNNIAARINVDLAVEGALVEVMNALAGK